MTGGTPILGNPQLSISLHPLAAKATRATRTLRGLEPKSEGQKPDDFGRNRDSREGC